MLSRINQTRSESCKQTLKFNHDRVQSSSTPEPLQQMSDGSSQCSFQHHKEVQCTLPWSWPGASISNRPMSHLEGRKHGSTFLALDVSETYCCCTVGSIHVIDLDLFCCHKAHPNTEHRIPLRFKRATLAYATLCIHVESLQLHAIRFEVTGSENEALSCVAGGLVVRPAGDCDFNENL